MAAQDYCLHPERSAVLSVHHLRDYADCHDLGVHHCHHEVDPATTAFQDAARSHQALQVPDDLLRRLDAFPFAESPPC